MAALERTDGGAATEAVAAGGETVVVEEVALAAEVDGTAVDGEGAG